MHIWTETPLTEIWNQLRYLESEANVYRLLTGSIQSQRTTISNDPTDAKKRASDIAACIKQADEYFAASEQVGLATKPLLQFYGAEALAKALILANNLSLSLIDINFHGLKTRTNDPSLTAYTKTPNNWQVESEFAITMGGVFPHLCHATNDAVPSEGVVLTFKDLVRVIPDLSSLYRRHYGEPSYCFYLYDLRKPNQQGQYEVLFNSNESLDDVITVFPEFTTGYEKLDSYPSLGFRSSNSLQDMPSFGSVEQGTVAGSYFVRPHVSGLHKSTTVMFAALFILSNIVRYKPSFWMEVIQGNKSGAASIAEALCNLFRRRFPNDILEGIWQEEFSYGVPARLS